MSIRTILKLTVGGLVLLVLTACGGGGGGGGAPQPTGPLDLDLPPGHGLSPGPITLRPGEFREIGNVTISCPADGEEDCDINVGAHGRATYAGGGGKPDVRILPLTAGPGQNLGDATPVFATDAMSTLKATLANPANVIPVLAATIARGRGDQRDTELTSEFFVKSISRNANGEYVVDFVLLDEDHQVTIPNSMAGCPSSCRGTVEGRTVYFWNNTDNDDDTASYEDGLGQFEYLASHTVALQPEDVEGRSWFVFGVRNEDFPMGTATYHGELEAETWETDDSSTDARQRISGSMRIVANFDMRALQGRVLGIRGTEPGSSTRNDWETSSFTLTEGRIVNGQFTATLDRRG